MGRLALHMACDARGGIWEDRARRERPGGGAKPLASLPLQPPPPFKARRNTRVTTSGMATRSEWREEHGQNRGVGPEPDRRRS